ncbi:hypothetical protein JHN59_16160 [Streptomyces sp. MBT49]|uniref:hypothetical protein n=1 Tax=Streptomyces sp. MBT49 TaxID=1488380 RepID=UPI00190BEC51|nr:hypothetical protein [Streptomyces sp. MBT49]MBK3626351.1 hypothetical protein [Streptomyces sp. MBT49]
MNSTANEGSQLTYGEDITLEDVAKIDAFLSERTFQSERAERGSGERQVARSLRAVRSHLVSEMERGLEFANSSNVSSDLLEGLHIQIHSAWNALWTLSSPWQSHPHYDIRRWRHVKFWDADAELLWQERLANASDGKGVDR